MFSIRRFISVLFIPIMLMTLSVQMINSAQVFASGEIILAADTQRITFQRIYVECALSVMDRKFRLEAVPWERAQRKTKDGVYNGFYMASRNDERDRYAILSEGFYNIEWMYVVRKDSNIIPSDPNFFRNRFSSVHGSARFKWLKKTLNEQGNENKITKLYNSEEALKVLDKRRVDVVFENNLNLENAFSSTGINRSEFNTYVVKIIPVGVYFSKAFLQREPNFLANFNSSIRGCKSK